MLCDFSKTWTKIWHSSNVKLHRLQGVGWGGGMGNAERKNDVNI